MAKAGITTYSEKIAGERGNHDLPARFDVTDGFLGITQNDARVLLSPKQARELTAFIRRANKS